MTRIFLALYIFFTISVAQAQHTGHEGHTAPAKPAAPKTQVSKPKPVPVKKKAIKPTAKPITKLAADTTNHQHQNHQEHQPAPTVTPFPAPVMDHQNHPAIPASTPIVQPAANPAQEHAGHDMHTMNGSGAGENMPTMSHSFSRNLPMTRNGSGTSWQPDATPMYAYMKHAADWNFMFHGAIFPRYTSQNIGNKNKRGDAGFGAPNWFMAMAQRPVGTRGLFSSHVMVSLDILTEGGNGYPLLFQSGETYKNIGLIDRQHPHDVVSELSMGYTHILSKDADIFGYFGFPGEPALGPPAFMHRISAFSNPDATLGHHWQDATHIVFGVGTLGFRYKNIKLEGSKFTGREPNENRYGFDKPTFDSYSYRITTNPSDNFSMQFSQGFIKSPEILSPEEDVTRTTASVLYSNSLTAEKSITSSFVWGLNQGSDNDHVEHSVLAESNLQLNKTSLYGRYEFIQKSAHELAIPETGGHADTEIYNVHALTMGASQIIANRFNTNLAVGVQGTVYSPEKSIQQYYGKIPVSGQVYLRITPGLMGNGTGKTNEHQH